MKSYVVVAVPKVRRKLKKYLSYLSEQKRNPQAVNNVLDDYEDTVRELSKVAGSLVEPQNKKLKERKLKRINFQRHNYFLLYRIDGDKAIITDIFHVFLNEPEVYL